MGDLSRRDFLRFVTLGTTTASLFDIDMCRSAVGDAMKGGNCHVEMG